jgi:hypothetical protein
MHVYIYIYIYMLNRQKLLLRLLWSFSIGLDLNSSYLLQRICHRDWLRGQCVRG